MSSNCVFQKLNINKGKKIDTFPWISGSGGRGKFTSEWNNKNATAIDRWTYFFPFMSTSNF
jgi:hypothetical protein